MQVYEPLGPVTDFLSILVALIGGAVTSKLGGFWFYPGAIVAFILFRQACIVSSKWVVAVKAQRANCA